MDIIKIVGDIVKELGFPIGMAIAMFWMLNTTVRDMSKQNADAINKLDATLDKQNATLDRQNVAIDKLNETINESDEKRFERITKIDAAVGQLITLSNEMKNRLDAIEKIRIGQAQRTPKKQAGA